MKKSEQAQANCMAVWLAGHHKILSTTRKDVEISQKTGKIEIKSLREGQAENIVDYQRR